MLDPVDLQAVLDAVADCVLVVDDSGRIRFAAVSVEGLLGYRPPDLLGQSVDLLLPEALRASHAALRAEFSRAPIPRPMGKGLRLAARRRDGTTVAVDVSLAPVAARGESLVVCTIRDASDRHGVEDRLQDTVLAREAQLRALNASRLEQQNLIDQLMVNMPGATAMFDRNMRLLAATPLWATVHGLGSSDYLGRSYYELLPQMPDRYRQLHRRGLAGESLIGEDEEIPRSEGRSFWLDWRIQPWRDASGEIGGILIFTSDTTERHRAADALRESESRFRGAFDSASIGMALVAPDGRWLQANDALCELLGYPAEELLAMRFQDLTHPDDLDADGALARELLSGARSHYQLEMRYLHKQGKVILALLSVSLVRDAPGEPRYFVSQIQDLTPQREAEAQLRERENLLRTITRVVPMAIGVFDADDVIRFANPEFERLSGERRSAEGRSAAEFLPESLHAVTKTHRARARRGEITHLTTTVVIDGELRYREITYVPFRDADGRVVGVCGLGYDVSDRMERDRALSASEALLSGIVSSMADGLTVHAFDGRLVEVNPAGERILGRARGDLVGGASPLDTLPGYDADEAPLADAEKPTSYTLRTGIPVRDRVLGLRDAAGALRWFRISAQSLPTLEPGKGRSVVTTFSDVTDQRRAYERIRSLAQRLETVREDERRGIAQLLHEGLAQDLFSVRLALQRLTGASRGNEEMARVYAEVGETLERCIEGTRKVAEGLWPTSLGNLRIADALRAHCRHFGEISGLAVEVVEAPPFPTLTEATRLLLFRAAQEGLTNVVRHAQATQVRITLRVRDDIIEMDVADNGIGIDRARLSRPGSLGLLGLRERCLALGGVVRIAPSTAGRGTVLTVSLPCAMA